MSAEQLAEMKHRDFIIMWAFRGLMALLGIAVTAMISSYSADVSAFRLEADIFRKELYIQNDRLIRIETQLSDHLKISEKRDNQVDQMQRDLDKKK